MNIGGLYTYSHERRLHTCNRLNEWFTNISNETPFVLLEVKQIPHTFSGVVCAYKVLTSDGEIGWISGIKEFFQELSS